MKKSRSILRLPGACAALLTLAACATGTSHVEKFADGIHPLDAALLGGAVFAVVAFARLEPDLAWRSSVTEAGAGRYRISIIRAFWSGAGEGELSGRFGREAERVAAAHACTRYTVLSYQERYDAQNVGAQKVGEGVIQCE